MNSLTQLIKEFEEHFVGNVDPWLHIIAPQLTGEGQAISEVRHQIHQWGQRSYKHPPYSSNLDIHEKDNQ